MTISRSKHSLETFAQHKVFAACSADAIARMLAECEVLQTSQGTTLFSQGDKGKYLWFVLSGTVQLTQGKEKPSPTRQDVGEGEFIGEELLLGFSKYRSSAHATSTLNIVRVPLEIVPDQIKSFEDQRATSVIRCIFDDVIAIDCSSCTNSKALRGIRSHSWHVIRQAVAWLIVIAAPALIFYFGERHPTLFEVNNEQWSSIRLLAVMVCGSFLWLFNLTRAYVAGLLMLFFLLALSIVPTHQTLSGFSSNAFFLALSLFGFSSVIIESGVLTRLCVWIASKWASNSLARQVAGLFAMVMLNSVLTSNRFRHHVWVQQSSTLYAVPKCRRLSWTFIHMVIWNNVTLFTPVFLTASAVNLALYGAMPEQFQAALGWRQWLASTLVMLAVMLMGTLLFLVVNRQFIREPAQVLRTKQRQHTAQQQVLGKIQPLEWILLLAAGIYIVAQLTTGTHKVDHRLIALIVLTTFLFGNMLKRHQINTLIDWRFLILLGAVIGLTNAMYDVGIANVIARVLPGLTHWINHSPLLFISWVAVVSLILNRYVVNGSILLGMWLLPLVVNSSLHPWVLIFTLLITENCFRLPAQLSTSFNTPRIKRFIVKWQAYFFVLRVLAVALSIPYWLNIEVL